MTRLICRSIRPNTTLIFCAAVSLELIACTGADFGEVATVGDGTATSSGTGGVDTTTPTGMAETAGPGETTGTSTVTGDGSSTGSSSATGSSTVTSDGGTTNSGSDTGSSGSTTSTEDSSSSTSTSADSTTTSTSDTGEETTTGSDSGTTTEDESSETGTDETTGDDTGVVVRGVVTRSATPSEDNDGVGTLYVSVLSSCNVMAKAIAWIKVDGADLAADDAEIPFTIEKVPNGEYYVSGYLDDDENALPDQPVPDEGDIIPIEGLAPKCIEVNVDGADISGLEINLNFVIPI